MLGVATPKSFKQSPPSLDRQVVEPSTRATQNTTTDLVDLAGSNTASKCSSYSSDRELRLPSYTPLGPNEIRLVQLLPGPDNVPIELQILPNVLLENMPKYAAVSYVWGDPDSTRSVRINGSLVEVTSNLTDFLWCQRKKLQDSSSSVTLWIDAICINQNDVPERNSQVLLMVHIYQRAERTIIWLGKERAEHERVFDLHDRISKAAGLHETTEAEKKILDWSSDNENKDFAMECYDSYSYLVSLPWFHRIWVKQEYIISPVVEARLGNRQLELTDFVALGRMIYRNTIILTVLLDHLSRQGRDELQSPADMGLRAITKIERERYARHRYLKRKLLHLLYEFRDSGATDPRDKVYGILGLLSNSPEWDDTQRILVQGMIRVC
ncbi:hypothetical protein ONS95_010880 [Cadophora gregata]|uniref:uncharacterized protein n=1 Tax=Cadophora gregata TaxID=51156 RepID=UPI0026DD3751|nr:uncharacterized protein ONS95_010880 [Cadophora gregata]KAK0119428.1 hypothetical protein ONS95_010880 [Cadophora gregata]KAK0120465.1 hypothetical protein ONS96_010679 [Cadophora gregata f. sp. sojae]